MKTFLRKNKNNGILREPEGALTSSDSVYIGELARTSDTGDPFFVMYHNSSRTLTASECQQLASWLTEMSVK